MVRTDYLENRAAQDPKQYEALRSPDPSDALFQVCYAADYNWRQIDHILEMDPMLREDSSAAGQQQEPADATNGATSSASGIKIRKEFRRICSAEEFDVNVLRHLLQTFVLFFKGEVDGSTVVRDARAPAAFGPAAAWAAPGTVP